MGCLAEYDKHPDDVLTFTVDWEPWLDGDSILTSVWDGDGLTVVSESETASTTTVKVSGGTDGNSYEPKNTITTSAGRTEVRRIRIVVQNVTTLPPVQVGWGRGSPG